jgi:hypothetical protein
LSCLPACLPACRLADAIVINKANTAPEGSIEKIREAAARINPVAAVYVTDSSIAVDAPEVVKGKLVVLIEDGPTLTHGGMAYGAGKVRCGWWGGCACAATVAEQVCKVQPGALRCVPGIAWHFHVSHTHPFLTSLLFQRAPPPAWPAPPCSLLQYAAEKYGAREIVDPRPYLQVGTGIRMLGARQQRHQQRCACMRPGVALPNRCAPAPPSS